MSATSTTNRMPMTTPASFQVAQSNNPTNVSTKYIGKGDVQGVGPEGKVYKAQLIMEIKDGEAASRYYANGKALPKNLSEAEARVHVRQQISKGTLGALELGNQNAFATNSGAPKLNSGTQQQGRSESMEKAVANNRIPKGTAMVSVDALVKYAGLKQKSDHGPVGEFFLGTEAKSVGAALRVAGKSVNDVDQRLKNPDFHYDAKSGSLYLANSARGAQAYVNFMNKFTDLTTDGNGKQAPAAQKFIKEGLPLLTTQFEPKLISGLDQITKNQAADKKALDNSGLTALSQIQTGINIAGGVAGLRSSRKVPKPVVATNSAAGHLPGIASRNIRNNPNNSNTPRQIPPAKTAVTDINGNVNKPLKVQPKSVQTTPPAAIGQNSSTHATKPTPAERPHTPVPQVAPLSPSARGNRKSTGTGFGTNILRPTPAQTTVRTATPPNKVKATAPIMPTAPTAVTARSDWSFGSVNGKKTSTLPSTNQAGTPTPTDKLASKPNKAPVATPTTQVTDPGNAKNSIPGATQLPGASRITPLTRGSKSSDTNGQIKPGQPATPLKPNADPDLAATASRTPTKPRNPGGTATLDAPAAQPITKKEVHTAPVLGELITTPPLLKPKTNPADRPEPAPVLDPKTQPLPKPLPTEKSQPSNQPLVPLVPLVSGQKANSSSAATPNPASTPINPDTTRTTATGYVYETTQYNQTDFANDVKDAKKAGGTFITPPTDGKKFFFMDVSNNGTGPRVIETELVGRASYLQWQRSGKQNEPSFIYIGRLDEMPVAALVGKEIVIANNSNHRNLLKLDINNEAELQKALVTKPAENGKVSGLSFQRYEGTDLNFKYNVSKEQGDSALRAVGRELGKIWRGDVDRATASLNNGGIGKFVPEKDRKGYGITLGNNMMNHRMGEINVDGAVKTSPLVSKVKNAIGRDKFWFWIPKIADTVLNANALGGAMRVGFDRTISTMGNNKPALVLGSAAVIGTSISNGFNINTFRANNDSADTAIRPPTKEEITLAADKTKLGEMRTKANQFDSPIDNPSFEKRWGPYVSDRTANGVTAWKPELFDPKFPQRVTIMQNEANLFYKKQQENELGFAFKVGQDADKVSAKLEQERILALKGTTPAVKDLKLGQDGVNSTTYASSPTINKYIEEKSRFNSTITNIRQTTSQTTATDSTYVPPGIPGSVFTGQQKPVGSASGTAVSPLEKSTAEALAQAERGRQTAAAKASGVQVTGGLVPASASQLKQQIAEIQAGSRSQESTLTAAIKTNNDALSAINSQIKPGQAMPSTLANLANNIRASKQAAETQLGQVRTTEDTLINNATNSYNTKLAQQRNALESQRDGITRQIALIQSNLQTYNSALSEAAATATGVNLGGPGDRIGAGPLGNTTNLTASNGTFKVKQEVLNALEPLIAAGGVPVAEMGKFLVMDNRNPLLPVPARQNGLLVPKSLNSIPSQIKDEASFNNANRQRNEFSKQSERIDGQIKILDSQRGNRNTPPRSGSFYSPSSGAGSNGNFVRPKTTLPQPTGNISYSKLRAADQTLNRQRGQDAVRTNADRSKDNSLIERRNVEINVSNTRVRQINSEAQDSYNRRPLGSFMPRPIDKPEQPLLKTQDLLQLAY